MQQTLAWLTTTHRATTESQAQPKPSTRRAQHLARKASTIAPIFQRQAARQGAQYAASVFVPFLAQGFENLRSAQIRANHFLQTGAAPTMYGCISHILHSAPLPRFSHRAACNAQNSSGKRAAYGFQKSADLLYSKTFIEFPQPPLQYPDRGPEKDINRDSF